MSLCFRVVATLSLIACFVASFTLTFRAINNETEVGWRGMTTFLPWTSFLIDSKTCFPISLFCHFCTKTCKKARLSVCTCVRPRQINGRLPRSMSMNVIAALRTLQMNASLRASNLCRSILSISFQVCYSKWESHYWKGFVRTAKIDWLIDIDFWGKTSGKQ